MPDPPVPDGTVMILVQNGKAELGRYNAPTPPKSRFPSFDHPVNGEDLQDEALQRVLAEQPNTDLHGPALTFICPHELAVRAVWQKSASSS